MNADTATVARTGPLAPAGPGPGSVMPADTPLLQVQDLRKTYRLRRTLWERLQGVDRSVAAVDGVSLPVRRGGMLGLVGESGCGKSTLAQMLVGLAPPTSGAILWQGAPLAGLQGAEWLAYRRGVQMVFQDTGSSLNPRKRIRRILAEAVRASGVARPDQAGRVAELMGQVGLDTVLLGRYPHELSGGQRQRVGIARALAMRPALLVADEPVSALDVSLQGQIINLLRELNQTLGVAIVLISHDLAVVARVCDSVAVMYAGRVVETGAPQDVLTAPKHPYTQALLEAVPRGLERRGRRRGVLPAESSGVTAGCRFRPRCPHALPACADADPPLMPVSPGNVTQHAAACHLILPQGPS